MTLWGKTPSLSNSSDEYAIPIGDIIDPVFKSYHDTILIVSAKEKSVSSRAGDGFSVNLRNKNDYRNFDGPLSVFYILALDAMIKIAKFLYSHTKSLTDSNENLHEVDFVEKISWCELLLNGAKNAFHDTFWDNEVGAYCSYVVNAEKLHFSELTRYFGQGPWR